MTNPTTAPGLGGPTPGATPTSGSETLKDPAPGGVSASFDDAMREAEMRTAEAHNRQIVEREAERRRVHLETSAKLREVVKGSDAHFELLALRQRWTLPLDDDDYVLWMQHSLLEQHGQAMADEVSQRRRAKAKEMARGPAIGVAIAAGLAVVAGIGWWLRGSTEGARPSPSEPAAAAPAQTQAAAASPVVTVGATTTASPSVAASSEAPTVTPSGAAASPATSAAPTSATRASAAPGAGTRPAPPKTGGPKKDMWEREF